MSTRLQPKQSQPMPSEAYDAEDGDMIVRSEEDHARAQQLMRMVEMATLVKAVALARIQDGKHYLDFQCSSMSEFAESMLPFGWRQAKKYIRIGRRFASLLPAFDENDTEGMELLTEGVDADGKDAQQVQELSSMGVSKLQEITKLDEEHFDDVVSKGRLVMPDGETSYTIDELKEMKTKEFSQMVEQARMDKKAYQARISQLEEEKEKLESERESDQEFIEEAEERYDDALELEKLYGPAMRSYESKKKRLLEAQSAVMEVRRLFLGDGFQLTSEDAQPLKQLCAEIIRELNGIYALGREAHAGALDTIQDTIADEGVNDFFESDELNSIFSNDEAPGGSLNDASPQGEGAPWQRVDEEEVSPERTKALREKGWVIERTLDHGHVLKNPKHDLETIPADTFDEAVKRAEKMQEAHEEGVAGNA